MENNSQTIHIYAARLIIRFVTKSLSLSEKEELDQWICDSEENLKIFNDLTDRKDHSL